MAKTKKKLDAAPVAEQAPEEEQIPYYETSKTEKYLNYILGSSETYPENPASRLEEYLYYLCKNGLKDYQKKLTALEGIIIDQATNEIGIDFNEICSIVKLNEELGYKAGKFTIHAEGTIQTSTLPAIAVPALTAEQLSQLLTAFSQEKVCFIKTNVENMLVNQSDSENSEIKFWYHNYYLTYALNGDTVVATYIAI